MKYPSSISKTSSIILSIINYFVILKILFQFTLLKKIRKYSSIVILFILILLLGEFKEFFIYDIYFIVLFFTFISLENQNNKIILNQIVLGHELNHLLQFADQEISNPDELDKIIE